MEQVLCVRCQRKLGEFLSQKCSEIRWYIIGKAVKNLGEKLVKIDKEVNVGNPEAQRVKMWKVGKHIQCSKFWGNPKVFKVKKSEVIVL